MRPARQCRASRASSLRFSSRTPRISFLTKRAASSSLVRSMAQAPTDAVLLYVTTPSAELAQGLLEKKLIACANVTAVTSHFTWKGKLETESEQLMIIKTLRSLIPDVTAYVKQNHPYEVPEVIALDIIAGHAPYLAWIRSSCTNEPKV